MKKSSKTLVASDESKNVYGFTVVTAGIDISDFLNNPVLLYNHDYDKLLGLCEEVDKAVRLLYVPSFDEDDKYAMKQSSKVEQGILRGSSIGIIPIEYDEVNQVMKKCSLKEISLTPVPANRNAIAIYDTNGRKLSAQEAREYMLSLSETTITQVTKNSEMKPSLITALVALCVQAGHTVTLSDKSTEDDFEAGLKTIGAKLSSLNVANTELSAKILKIEKEAQDAAAKEHSDLLKKAVDDKLLTAESANSLKGLGLPELKVVLSAVTPVTLRTVEKQKDTETKTDLSGDRANWTYDDFAMKAPQDLEKMQVTNNALFEKLLSAKVNKARNEYAIEI